MKDLVASCHSPNTETNMYWPYQVQDTKVIKVVSICIDIILPMPLGKWITIEIM